MCKPSASIQAKLSQRTLCFNAGLRIGGTVGPSPVDAAVIAARAAAAAAQAAEASAAAAQAATAATATARDRDAGVFFDPQRPVRVQFAPGLMRLKVQLTTRRPLVIPHMQERKRVRLSDFDKDAALLQVKHLPPAQAAAQLRTIPGFEKVDGGRVKRWRDAAAERQAAGTTGSAKKAKKRGKGGRRVNEAFESAVRDQLIYTELEQVDGKEKAVVKANVVHGYAIIRRAAQKAQKSEQFAADRKVQKLEFSDPWIIGWIKRNTLRRRRITAAEKQLPEPPVVQERMSQIQATIVNGPPGGGGGFSPSETISADETGVFFGAAPKNQYVPEDAERATAPESNEKARFTALLWGTAAGEMGPSWNVIKCSVKGWDLSSARVLKTLHETEPGFSAADGWELGLWVKELTLTVKGKQITATHKRPYLIHKETLVVVTLQLKAWMDTPGMVMWSEVQLQPWAARRTGRALVVWDNCGPHKTEAVKTAFLACSITQEELPPKMTDTLQETCSNLPRLPHLSASLVLLHRGERFDQHLC